MTFAANLRPWTFSEKFVLRFFVILFVWYVIPFPFEILEFLGEWWNTLWMVAIPWIGAHILHLKEPITIFPNGSGDTTFNYVALLVQFVGSFVVALIWSLLDRNRRSYYHLHHWLRVLVRYYLGMNMLLYGFIKVFHLQMPFPYLSQLIQPLGDKSPMGLAWTYMGYSPGFSAFTGWAEVIAGILLFWRRTTTLGAIFCVGVSINIVAVNMFFDVPVKLFSSMLLLMSFFLLAPDVKRLIDVLLLNKTVPPKVYHEYIGKRWLRIVFIVVKYLYITYTLFVQINSDIQGVSMYGDKRPKPPLYGIYDAKLMVRENDTIQPLTTDSTRWKTLVLQSNNNAIVKMTNDSLRYYAFEVDTTAKKAILYKFTDTAFKSTLYYDVKGDDLELNGKLFNDTILIRLKKRDINSFRLVNRGFRWINEYPFNR